MRAIWKLCEGSFKASNVECDLPTLTRLTTAHRHSLFHSEASLANEVLPISPISFQFAIARPAQAITVRSKPLAQKSRHHGVDLHKAVCSVRSWAFSARNLGPRPAVTFFLSTAFGRGCCAPRDEAHSRQELKYPLQLCHWETFKEAPSEGARGQLLLGPGSISIAWRAEFEWDCASAGCSARGKCEF